ncbi:MAG: hypothetical protein JXB46_09075 [Candidatus Eisenbacteria bacterium]|nr:hypothetical protein [Candidatus Eisenbacteria bacterium]
MSRTATVFCVTLLTIAALLPSVAWCREILVEVTSISASMRPADEEARSSADVEFDQRLEPFSKNLRSLFAYERYTFISKNRIAIAPGSALPFQLPEHFSLEVAPEEFARGGSGMIEMTITLYRDQPQGGARSARTEPEREVVLRTKIRLKNGGTVLLGGPPIRSGILVMALSARG